MVWYFFYNQKVFCRKSIFEKFTEKIKTFLEKHSLRGTVLPLNSVGVQGDARSYAHPCLVTGVKKWSDVTDISTKMTGEIREVNRMIIEIGNIEGESAMTTLDCNHDSLEFLREADAICTQALFDHNLYKDIWQMPVVLLPLTIGGKPTIVMRPIHSSEAMTANYAEIDFSILNEVWQKLKLIGTGALYYDVTHKPPGTIEWE